MNDNEMLNFIYKNAQMGVVGIDAVESFSQSSQMVRELKAQKQEYNKIAETAKSIIKRKNGKLKEIPEAEEKMVGVMSRMKLIMNSTDSKIAQMMIQGSAMGISKIIEHKDDYDGKSRAVVSLANKLKKTEEYNIDNMKAFL